MSIETIVHKIKHTPEKVSFNEIIAAITAHYDYTPSRFSNGLAADTVINEAGSNEGSCKIFAFAQLHGLSETETLACFGDYYRQDVLENPADHDHANIRTFMRHGWAGIHFEGAALSKKAAQ